MKTVISPGILAKKLGVSPKTVCKWFDEGQLKGFRIPGGKHRRIYIASAIAFAEKHGMRYDND